MFCFSYKQILICCCWVWSLESCCCQCMVFLWTWLPHTSEFCWSTSILSSLQVSVDERKQVSLSASCNFLAPSYIITFIKCRCIYHFLRHLSLKKLPKYKPFKLFETETFLNEQSEWNSISICSSLILCLLSYGWKFGKSLCIITGFLHTCFGKKTLSNPLNLSYSFISISGMISINNLTAISIYRLYMIIEKVRTPRAVQKIQNSIWYKYQ